MERNGARAPRQPCSELFLSAVYRLNPLIAVRTVFHIFEVIYRVKSKSSHSDYKNDRFRYVSKNSKGDLRKCCLTKTYDPRQLACCQHHELKAVGTCFEPCEANPNGIHCRNGNRP